MIKAINKNTLDDAIRYHEMLIHMTERRGGKPNVLEYFTLRVLRQIREEVGA